MAEQPLRSDWALLQVKRKEKGLPGYFRLKILIISIKEIAS